MKDQPTEATMDPLHVGRLKGPSAPFNHRDNRRPFAVEQRKVVVEREWRSRVFLERMNGQDEDKPTLGVGDTSCTLQAGFKQVVGGHAAV